MYYYKNICFNAVSNSQHTFHENDKLLTGYFKYNSPKQTIYHTIYDNIKVTSVSIDRYGTEKDTVTIEATIMKCLFTPAK